MCQKHPDASGWWIEHSTAGSLISENLDSMDAVPNKVKHQRPIRQSPISKPKPQNVHSFQSWRIGGDSCPSSQSRQVQPHRIQELRLRGLLFAIRLRRKKEWMTGQCCNASEKASAVLSRLERLEQPGADKKPRLGFEGQTMWPSCSSLHTNFMTIRS